MRLRFGLGTILASATMLACAVPVSAQSGGLSDYYVPSTPSINAPLPTSNPRESGVFIAGELVYLSQTRTMRNQIIATRGFFDSGGLITGTPGQFIGSNSVALQTDDLGRSTFAPGYRITAGWKTEDNVSFYVTFMQTGNASYNAGASITPQFFKGPANLADTFITAPVFNFPPDYAGPLNKLQFDVTSGQPGNAYGIWNAASEMTIDYIQRYTTGDIGTRVPMLETEYSRVYGTGGIRYAWFYERFIWRTVSRDVNGLAGPSDSAEYKNTISQRSYGPFIGCGHEIYLGKTLAISGDVSVAGLFGVAKELVKYELGDPVFPTQNKRKRSTFEFVPNTNVEVNATWYPLEGVQLRAGVMANMFFNTVSMKDPVAFNIRNHHAQYGTQVFRLVYGFNVGAGFFF
ncbi:MAG: hypothetical protein U0798_18195 [Gemmataceae bacterium]